MIRVSLKILVGVVLILAFQNCKMTAKTGFSNVSEPQGATQGILEDISDNALDSIAEPEALPIIPEEIVPADDEAPLRLPAKTSWYWQLQKMLKTGYSAKVYDIDLFDTSAEEIRSLKEKSHIVICYFSGGTYEEWRPDAKGFPKSGLGRNMDDWPGEKWLDIRNNSIREIMKKRMDLAVEKGCDGLEPDNMDGYSNKNGVGLSKQDQIEYNSWMSNQAHQRKLLVGLKNSTDLVEALVDKFDFAVVEQCFQYDECDAYAPFIDQDKAVLVAEYSKFSSQICDQSKKMGLSTVFFNLALDGKKYTACGN